MITNEKIYPPKLLTTSIEHFVEKRKIKKWNISILDRNIDRDVFVGVNHIDLPQTFEIVRYQIMLLQTVRTVDDISRL